MIIWYNYGNLVYFMEIWYNLPHFGILYQVKYVNPGWVLRNVCQTASRISKFAPHLSALPVRALPVYI
jgi:hypothetical protein